MCGISADDPRMQEYYELLEDIKQLKEQMKGDNALMKRKKNRIVLIVKSFGFNLNPDLI